MPNSDKLVSLKIASAMMVIRVLLRREKKMSAKTYLMPFAMVGPIDDDEKEELANYLRSIGYAITIEGSTFAEKSHMLIDWTNR
jgi:hypothetical protein